VLKQDTLAEAAGYEFTPRDLRPGTSYVVEVAACDKRFLLRSACTRPSSRVQADRLDG
jgi:hypothetical protein